MEGYEGWGRDDDYADADLLALRQQEARLKEEQDAARRREQCAREKELRRKNIKELGAKPVA